MILSSLNVVNFRNISSQTKLDFDSSCNIFCGKNGSGKTSLLEAIYYLALGRSFRSHILHRVIKHGENSLSLFGKATNDKETTTIGITKSVIDGKRIKISGEDVSSIIAVTRLLPLQLLNHDCYSLLYEGSKPRRQFIDWGLFHVEHSFIDIWQKTERILKQRNAALRKKIPYNHLKIWDQELVDAGNDIHRHREQYINLLLPIADKVIKQLLPDINIAISGYAGWNLDVGLEKILQDNFKNDLAAGYTTAGPHRFDIKILSNKTPAKDALSRGQQKILLFGLKIAQSVLLKKLTGKKCIYLLDDIAAELDSQKLLSLITILIAEDSQLFVTGLSDNIAESFRYNNGNWLFNIDNGNIKQIDIL